MSRVAIENVTPSVDNGAFPVKRTAGDTLNVEADVIADGHEVVSVALLWRSKAETEWREQRMRPLGNDRWHARFPLEAIGTYEYAVEAWRDAFATWRDELAKKHAAGVNTSLEIQEGLHLIEHTAAAANNRLAGFLHALTDRLTGLSEDEQRTVLLSPETAGADGRGRYAPLRRSHRPAADGPGGAHRCAIRELVRDFPALDE